MFGRDLFVWQVSVSKWTLRRAILHLFTSMRTLTLYEDYTRQDVHSIFDPDSTFTPQAGTWGMQGIVKLPGRVGDFIFFVTFGRQQSDHDFDEGITPEGVLRWQSQPKQRLSDNDIREMIGHDEAINSIYLFLRTSARRLGSVEPYTYLGRLKYLIHDHDRERPVYFTWQILDWGIPDEVIERMQLHFEGGAPQPERRLIPSQASDSGLTQVPVPKGQTSRAGLPTPAYAGRIQFDHAEQDARNRRLGLAGELAVIERERTSLIAIGRPDLADRVLHVASVEGDAAGYDIKSFTSEGEGKFIEVKTTKGSPQTAFYLSANEVRFAADHADRYYLFRVFDFDEANACGKVFVQRGDLGGYFSLKPVQFRAVLSVS